MFLLIFTLLHYIFFLYRAHITSKVKQRFREINTIPVVIPGGCTSKIQPLDVCLNKPFKSYVRRYWSDYIMQNGMHQSKIKPPTREIVTYWISKGVKQLQENRDMVINSFNVCGITSSARYRSELPEQDIYLDSADELDDPFRELDSLITDI